MGLGISQLIPFALYLAGMFAAILSLFYNPLVGVFFLFPLLPYENIFVKIQTFPLGNNLNDIIIMSILLGLILRNNKVSKKYKLNNYSLPHMSGLNIAIFFLFTVTFIGLLNALFRQGPSLGLENTLLQEWKNYMLLPLIFYLTFKNIKNAKDLKMLSFLLIFGILGASYYFSNSLKWMNLWHYSNRARSTMDGLFVYLGPNHYGAFFVHFIFILIGIFLFNKSKFKKLILIGIISLTIYCIIYTYSRGAYLGFLVGLLFLGLVKEKKILVFLLLFLIFWRFLVPVSVVERIDMTKNEQGELESSAALRVELWNVAWRMFKESPIIGIGFNSFRFETEGVRWRDTHNYYLKMLTELGILGLVSFLYFCFISFMNGWNLFVESKDGLFKGLGLGFATCVISALITNAFGDRWSYLCLGAYFWVFLGIVARARIINKEQMVMKNGEQKDVF